MNEFRKARLKTLSNKLFRRKLLIDVATNHEYDLAHRQQAALEAIDLWPRGSIARAETVFQLKASRYTTDLNIPEESYQHQVT